MSSASSCGGNGRSSIHRAMRESSAASHFPGTRGCGAAGRAAAASCVWLGMKITSTAGFSSSTGADSGSDAGEALAVASGSTTSTSFSLSPSSSSSSAGSRSAPSAAASRSASTRRARGTSSSTLCGVNWVKLRPDVSIMIHIHQV